MRKIIVISDITLDGVVQAPGALDEDTSGGFEYGGWIAPYLDKVTFESMKKNLEPANYLLGRKTFEIFVNYWPKHADFWPGINREVKYVLSKTMKKSDPIAIGWKNTVFLESLADIRKIKNSNGSDIQVWGSGNLVQLLLKNDLVDEIWLKIYPLTLGTGKKLFDSGTMSAAFTLVESSVTPSGVIMVNYKRAGKVKTGAVVVE
jgi:dihydrofolate reductase